jgi:hypothetical protein
LWFRHGSFVGSSGCLLFPLQNSFALGIILKAQCFIYTDNVGRNVS